MNRKFLAYIYAFKAIALLAIASGATADSGSGHDTMQDMSQVVATVNGQPITRTIYDGLVRTHVGVPNPYTSETPQETEDRNKALLSIDRNKVIEHLVTMEVLAQKAQERGMHLRPELLTEAELAYKTLLEQELVRELIAEIEIDPGEIQKRYTEQKPDQKYKLSHILLRTEEEARAVIIQLEKGANFEKLARSYTTDKSSSKDGSLGWLMLNQMLAPFAEAVTRLERGQTTGEPVQTLLGWHVIRLHETRAIEKPPFQAMYEILRSQILQEKVRARVRQIVKEAQIEIIQQAQDR